MAEIRKMIHKTKVNINTHINTVDQLTSKLTTITEKSKETMSGKKAEYVFGQGLTKGHRNVQSHKVLPSSVDGLKSSVIGKGSKPKR